MPAYAVRPQNWTDSALTPRVRRLCDSRGFARPDGWYAGAGKRPAADRGALVIAASPGADARPKRGSARTEAIIQAARAGYALEEADIVRLFGVQGPRTR